MVYSYEDMLKMIGENSSSTIGETVLKVLEQFIYYYPEQWYQWKKYHEIKTAPSPDRKVAKPTSPLVLDPIFVKVS